MTLYDYKRARNLRGESFYALLMAAFAEADTFNYWKLRDAFPEIADEVRERYDAPAGLLVGERDGDLGIKRTTEGLCDAGGKLIRPVPMED